jgi:hypothetical protein
VISSRDWIKTVQGFREAFIRRSTLNFRPAEVEDSELPELLNAMVEFELLSHQKVILGFGTSNSVVDDCLCR